MKHDTHIEARGAYLYAVCTCGWDAPRYAERDARAAATEHLAEARPMKARTRFEITKADRGAWRLYRVTYTNVGGGKREFVADFPTRVSARVAAAEEAAR